MALTTQAHQKIATHFQAKPKNVAVDATCGKGNDTEYLLRLGFKKVIAFDVQAEALEMTKRRVSTVKTNNLQLIHAGHETLNQHLSEPIDCIVYNFGYLPGADKSLTTNTENSLTSLRVATELLSPNGFISLLCYPGHAEGKSETEAIREWVKTFNKDWIVNTYLAEVPIPSSPILITIEKRLV